MEKLRVLLITQNESLYFGKSISYFLSKAPSWVNISGVILLDASPFGKPQPVLKMLKRTYDVFGLAFCLNFFLRLANENIFHRRDLIKNVLKKFKVEEIKLIKKNINDKGNLEIIRKFKPDLIISIAANQIFKRTLLSLPKFGSLNLHSALLPRYKGLMPTFWAMKNDEKEMGVSVFFMDEGIDTGKILVQKTFEIRHSDSLDSLIKKNKKIGMDALLEAIHLIQEGNYQTKGFAPEDGSYYSFPKKEDVREFRNAGKIFW